MNRIDIKSLIIGILLCLCILLLTGFGNSGSAGRYQVHLIGPKRIHPIIFDSATGESRMLKTDYGMKASFDWNKQFKEIGKK